MEKSGKSFGFLNSNLLKLIAMAAMLADHTAHAFSLHVAFHCFGRIAFPIFAFQIAEGYAHTHDFSKYLKRLFILALVSEVPFDLFASGKFFDFSYQNVIFTFLLALCAISAIDRSFQKNEPKEYFTAAFICVLTLLTAYFFNTDYGFRGVLTVIAFYIFGNVRFGRIAQTAVLLCLFFVFYDGMPVTLPLLHIDVPVQSFAVFAMVPICLYNGKKGKKSRTLTFCEYAFYPVHMLILYLISVL